MSKIAIFWSYSSRCTVPNQALSSPNQIQHDVEGSSSNDSQTYRFNATNHIQMSSDVLHRSGWLVIFSVGVIVLYFAQVAIFVFVLFIRLFMDVRGVVLDIFYSANQFLVSIVVLADHTFDLCIITSWFSHQHCCCFSVQWISRIWISK